MSKGTAKARDKSTAAKTSNGNGLTLNDREKELIELIRRTGLSEFLKALDRPAVEQVDKPDQGESRWAKFAAGLVSTGGALLAVLVVCLVAARMSFHPVIVLKQPDRVERADMIDGYASELELAMKRGLSDLANTVRSAQWQLEPLGLLPGAPPHYRDVIGGAKPSLTSLLPAEIAAFLRFMVNVDQYEFTVHLEQPVPAEDVYFRLLDNNGWSAPQQAGKWREMERVAAENGLLAVRRVEPEADLRFQWNSNLTGDNRNALAKSELKRFPSLVSALILVIGRTDGKKPPEIGGQHWSKPQSALLDAEVLLQRRFAAAGPKLTPSDLQNAIAKLTEARQDPLLKNFALTQQGVAYLKLAEDGAPGDADGYWERASSVFGEVEKDYPTAKFYRLRAQTRLGAPGRTELESLKGQAQCADLEAPFGNPGTSCASIVFGSRVANGSVPDGNSPPDSTGAIGPPFKKEVRNQ